MHGTSRLLTFVKIGCVLSPEHFSSMHDDQEKVVPTTQSKYFSSQTVGVGIGLGAASLYQQDLSNALSVARYILFIVLCSTVMKKYLKFLCHAKLFH